VWAHRPGPAARLETAGIVAAVRGGRLRVSWHVYNTVDDVDRVLDVLTG
jgi:selenocysteine lyase/cysteine desulfurase